MCDRKLEDIEGQFQSIQVYMGFANTLGAMEGRLHQSNKYYNNVTQARVLSKDVQVIGNHANL